MKNLMNRSRRFVTFVALMCAVVLGVNAQTEETESKGQKFFRLTKAADDNPTDWNAQLEAGHFLLDKENGIYNMSQATTYYERLFHLATDYNKEIPDSVIRETGMMLVTMYIEKKDVDKSLYYIDAMIQAGRAGLDIDEGYMISFESMGIMYSMMKGNLARSLSYLFDLRERMTRNKMAGIEYTDMTTAMLYEGLFSKYKEMYSDKLMELTFDGKKYTVISMKEWNIEKPFIGWMNGEGDDPILMYGEDGKVYDDIHGTMEYSFRYDKDGVRPQEGCNSRLITVTPERRQQMVDAYRNYMKKAKKDKK